MSEKEDRYEKLLKQLETQNKQLESQTEAINNLQKQLSQKPATTSTLSTSESKPREHATLEEMDACPECRTKYRAEEFKEKIVKVGVPAYIQNLRKEREKEPLVCEGCGTGVTEKEESCPLCGNRKARKR
jgi:RNA polymerase subunit RPABC4/transcription elongation factor Spt4